MAAHFTADTSLGAGYGIISIAQVNCNTEPSFALYRASDGLCLTPSGWQNSEIFLQANNWDCDSNTLRLSIDASIVDHLDALDTYKIIIKHDEQDPISQSLVIENIVYSSMHGGQGLGFTEVKPEPTPELEPEPIPEPVQTPEELSPMQEPLPEITPVQKKNPMPMIITVLLILILLAGGIWWYLKNQDQAPQNPTTNTQESSPTSNEQAPAEPEIKSEDAKPEEAKPEEQDKTDTSTPEVNNQATGANTAKTLSPMQQARDFLRQDNQGQASLDLAQSLQIQSQKEPSAENLDALFLLLEDAAQKNIPEAMLMVAKYYDPSNTEPKGSIEADANEAYAWYTKALAAGVSDATKHLDQLKTWAKQAASNGDKTAHDLLTRWK